MATRSVGPAQLAAWYHSSRAEFLAASQDAITDRLAARAAEECLEVYATQTEEWHRSVDLLQHTLDERIPMLREALASPDCSAVQDVILEFNFRRRGLRIDCLLIADGALFVVEFKRSRLTRADQDQVMAYAVNLIEFHKVTQEWCRQGGIVVPILALTTGRTAHPPQWPGLAGHSWEHLARRPLACDRGTLREGLRLGLAQRRARGAPTPRDWLGSPFRPSSSILDAALSLYGSHDVAAIQEHAAPQAAIEAATREIREHAAAALAAQIYHVIFLSGAPGSGKTLVGLDLVMRGAQADTAVFVTGNAPLVDVLNTALRSSYRRQGKSASSWTPTGYHRNDARLVASAADFKIVKAHDFLGKRVDPHRQEDGRLLVFDEAQRTYERGRLVLGTKLPDHEADMILDVQRRSFPQGGAVVVALVGHKQAINRGERGIVAWLEAARRHGWTFSVADETLELAEFQERERWAADPDRRRLEHGHLRQSMRYYRNAMVEQWADAVVEGHASRAAQISTRMASSGDQILLTRDLRHARSWARAQAIGGMRAGLIASGQARRLAAEGLFVDHKPDIATWMLAPSTDVRSSNALETVQNQYQVQGLELDYTIVCWDLDFRRGSAGWRAYKMSGADWQNDRLLDIARNGYRVLLTRARKGSVIFVPRGDPSGEDTTREAAAYDAIESFLLQCGATSLRDGPAPADMEGARR